MTHDAKQDPKSSLTDGRVRLSKLMSERSICSRREADEYIAKGLVLVDGKPVHELGIKVLPSCKIELAAQAKKAQTQSVTVLLNKPIGYVSAQPEKDYLPAIQLLTRENFAGENLGNKPQAPRALDGLAVCGRLDIDSIGLLVFSQDGRVAKKLIGEDSQIEKEYIVRVEAPGGGEARAFLSAEKLKLLNHGLVLDEGKLKPAKVEWINESQLRFILKEGKKRQVRRMCELVGLRVQKLMRVRVGRIKLGTLPEGKWRYLNEGEEF